MVNDDRVRRWSASSAGITTDVLAMSVGDLRRLVAITVAELASDPGDPDAPLSPLLAANLRELGRELLSTSRPETMGGLDNVLVSADEFLMLLPFEALDTGGPGYTPLLSRCNVGYLRYSGETYDVRGRSRQLLLVDPGDADDLRRFALSRQNLEAARVEGTTVAEYFPEIDILSGARANKAELFSRLGNAQLFYVATHVIRDPDAPFLSFLPLATPSTPAPPEAGRLDVGDVREANLRGCPLVVLSGCSSGAAYVATASLGPSLGDAFLDAGAGAVVQTFWAVRDEAALTLMREFLRGWRKNGQSPFVALTEARRSLMVGDNGIRHPFSWAAYSIKLRRP
jgi:hypothetical protein